MTRHDRHEAWLETACAVLMLVGLFAACWWWLLMAVRQATLD